MSKLFTCNFCNSIYGKSAHALQCAKICTLFTHISDTVTKRSDNVIYDLVDHFMELFESLGEDNGYTNPFSFYSANANMIAVENTLNGKRKVSEDIYWLQLRKLLQGVSYEVSATPCKTIYHLELLKSSYLLKEIKDNLLVRSKTA